MRYATISLGVWHFTISCRAYNHFSTIIIFIVPTVMVCFFSQSKFEKSALAGTSHEVFNDVSLATFDVILRCAFSYNEDVQLKG